MADISNDDNVTPLRGAPDPRAQALRIPPQNEEAEQGLLGTILHNNKAYERVAEFLRPEHFADPVHGRIFAACQTLIERQQVADVVTLRNMFERDGELTEVGGAQYLAQLVAALVSTVNAEEYGRIVYDCYLRRELIDLGETVVNEAHDFDAEHSALRQIEDTEQRLYNLATEGQIEGDFRSFKSVLTEAVLTAEAAQKRESHLVGVTTGFRDLDKRLGGLHPSDLIIVAGRPAMGKTALATNIAYNAAAAHGVDLASSGAVVGYFSLEMSAEQLVTRVLAEQTQLSGDRIRRGDLTQNDFDRLVSVSGKLSRIPLFIDDSPGLTVSALRTRARRLKRTQDLGLIVVDYLQLLQSASTRRNDSRVQELSEITRGLKTLAKELNVPVIGVSQLSRAVEQREDKRPQLSDLRESGSIEQDADVVMLIYREEYYLRQREPTEGTAEHLTWQDNMNQAYNLAELNVAKQRHGPTGRIKLHFEGEFTRFSDHADESQMPEAHD
jgi:replicative DNA helicase